jgi:hypothetical protein
MIRTSVTWSVLMMPSSIAYAQLLPAFLEGQEWLMWWAPFALFAVLGLTVALTVRILWPGCRGPVASAEARPDTEEPYAPDKMAAADLQRNRLDLERG